MVKIDKEKVEELIDKKSELLCLKSNLDELVKEFNSQKRLFLARSSFLKKRISTLANTVAKLEKELNLDNI